jgi:hypothetical protein
MCRIKQKGSGGIKNIQGSSRGEKNAPSLEGKKKEEEKNRETTPEERKSRSER